MRVVEPPRRHIPAQLARGRRWYAGPLGPLVAVPAGASEHRVLIARFAAPDRLAGPGRAPSSSRASGLRQRPDELRQRPDERGPGRSDGLEALAARLDLGAPVASMRTDRRKCLILVVVCTTLAWLAGEAMWRFAAIWTVLLGVVVACSAAVGCVAAWGLIDRTEVHLFEGGVLSIDRSGRVRAQLAPDPRRRHTRGV